MVTLCNGGVSVVTAQGYGILSKPIERFHRTMNTMLWKVINAHQRDWEVWLPFVMVAYRSSRHEATGFSPNLLVWTGNRRTGGPGVWQATRCVKNTKHEQNNFLFRYMHVIIFGYRYLYARYIRVHALVDYFYTKDSSQRF